MLLICSVANLSNDSWPRMTESFEFSNYHRVTSSTSVLSCVFLDGLHAFGGLLSWLVEGWRSLLGPYPTELKSDSFAR